MNTISTGTSLGNISAFVTNNSRAMARQMGSIASGLAVARPADGIADYFVGRKLNVQARAYAGIRRELQEASSLLNVAESSMAEIYSDLTNMKDLITRFFSSNVTDDEKKFLATKIDELKGLVLHTVEHTVFNKRHLLKDSSDNPLVQIRVNPHDLSHIFSVSFGKDLEVDISGFDLASFGSDKDGALAAIDEQILRAAKFMGHLAGTRTGLHAQYNLSELAQNTSLQQRENTLGANDMEEVMLLTRRQITQSAAVSMFAQGNVMRASVLNLLN
jgi:flagellin-like hook-associated protein FlgL